MKVSVIIPGSSSERLQLTLRSLMLQKEHISDITVVEDWVYTEDLRIMKMCLEHGCKYVKLPTPKRTPADFRAPACRNVGIKHGTGEIVLYLDDDCIPCTWYMERLVEIHSQYDKIFMTADRIIDETPFTDDYYKAVDPYYWIKHVDSEGFRRLMRHPLKEHTAFWDNTIKTFPWGNYSNNLSVQRKYTPLVGDFINFYGYGEEDIYWAYKACKAGLRSMYPTRGTDLYVYHINHPRVNDYSRVYSAINRLWLYDQDPSFEEACKAIDPTQDWTTDIIKLIKEKGINNTNLEFLPALPEPLCSKYYKHTPSFDRTKARIEF